MRAVIVFAGLALAAAAVVPRYAGQMHGKAAPAALVARAETPSVPADSSGGGAVVIPRDDRGHFRVDARVDGRRIQFMVDTGASVIALTESDAAALGIHPARREFAVAMMTANGAVQAAPVRLNMVEVGDVVVRDVVAVVLPDHALGENLLGMSFLSRLRHFEYADGRLVLEQ